jgi:hypothetical protein
MTTTLLDSRVLIAAQEAACSGERGCARRGSVSRPIRRAHIRPPCRVRRGRVRRRRLRFSSPRVGTPAGERAPTHSQAVATASAAQISLIRAPLSTPIRSISTATDTDSTESRLTALLRPIGSSPGSSTTSLGKPRIVVVQGATSARRRRGMAASRDNTTTGRRPICGGSHHHTSPRRGRSFTLRLRHCGTSPDRPTRPLRRWGGRRTPPRMPHQLPWLDDARAARPEHRRSTRNLTCRREIGGRWLADLHRRWC